MTVPVLQFADYAEPFLLETDTSGDGLRAVLSQKDANGKWHPVTLAVDPFLNQKGTTIPVNWSFWC